MHIQSRLTGNIYDVKEGKCSCQQTVKTGIPCQHLITVARSTNSEYLSMFAPRWKKFYYTPASTSNLIAASSPIIQPLSLVLLELADVLAISTTLAIDHTPHILRSIGIGNCSFSRNLSVKKVGFDFCTICQFQHTWTLPNIILVATLILKVAVAKMIDPLAVTLLGLGVQLTFILLMLKGCLRLTNGLFLTG